LFIIILTIALELLSADFYYLPNSKYICLLIGYDVWIILNILSLIYAWNNRKDNKILARFAIAVSVFNLGISTMAMGYGFWVGSR